MFVLESRQVGTFQIVNSKHNGWALTQGLTLSVLTSLSTGFNYFLMDLKPIIPKLSRTKSVQKTIPKVIIQKNFNFVSKCDLVFI